MSAVRIATLCLLVLLAAGPALAAAQEPQPQPKASESIWQNEWEVEEAQRSEVMARRIIDAVKERDPQRAEELQKLYDKSPESFWEELRREFRQRERDRQGPPPPPGERRPSEMPPSRDDQDRWGERLKRRLDEFIQWLEKNDPEEAASLAELKEKDPDAYLAKSGEARRRYEPIMRAQRDNPELAKVLMKDMDLQKQQDDILRRLRTADAKDKEAMTKELEQVISTRFDVILLKKQLMYDELYARLLKLQEELEKRQSELEVLKNSKEQNVQDRMKELTTQVEKINWD